MRNVENEKGESIMTRHAPVFVVLSALIILGGAGGVAVAQIPDVFTNLKVLPKDIGKRELINVMRGFAGAVGGRCNYCHVGENADTLEGFDWASDDVETKPVARAMMKMTSEKTIGCCRSPVGSS